MTLSGQAKNSTSFTNQAIKPQTTWDEADYTWDNAPGSWDKNNMYLAKQTKNTATFANGTKN